MMSSRFKDHYHFTTWGTFFLVLVLSYKKKKYIDSTKRGLWKPKHKHKRENTHLNTYRYPFREILSNCLIFQTDELRSRETSPRSQMVQLGPKLRLLTSVPSAPTIAGFNTYVISLTTFLFSVIQKAPVSLLLPWRGVCCFNLLCAVLISNLASLTTQMKEIALLEP